LNISHGRQTILQFPNTSKINEQCIIGRRANRNLGMFGWLNHGANECKLQMLQAGIITTKNTTKCITGIREKIAMFYSDMSARDHNMNFPKTFLHNLISDVLCLRVVIGFWRNN
jgi:hypothetical protein